MKPKDFYAVAADRMESKLWRRTDMSLVFHLLLKYHSRINVSCSSRVITFICNYISKFISLLRSVCTFNDAECLPFSLKSFQFLVFLRCRYTGVYNDSSWEYYKFGAISCVLCWYKAKLGPWLKLATSAYTAVSLTAKRLRKRLTRPHLALLRGFILYIPDEFNHFVKILRMKCLWFWITQIPTETLFCPLNVLTPEEFVASLKRNLPRVCI
jgi:hypothetical protein